VIDPHNPVIVTRWADGTVPTQPASLEAADALAAAPTPAETLSEADAATVLSEALADVFDRSGYADAPVLAWVLAEAGYRLVRTEAQP
jgi:hypothetical protein